MVSSLRILPDVLSQFGCHSTVYAEIDQEGITDAGTVWRNQYTEPKEKFDVLIYNRQLSDGYPLIRTKKRVLWTHDLPHPGFIPNPKLLNIINRTVFMSGFAEGIWRTFFPGIKKSVTIPNGVDKDVFYPGEKDLDYIIFCSAPNRGLDWLPFIFSRVRGRTRKSLYLKAFSNMRLMHPHEQDNRMDNFWVDTDFEHVYSDCIANNVEICDPVPQPDLAIELGKASLMIMPTKFPEICSNSILQALASGVPIVTTGDGLGSAHEWIKHGKNGFLTKYHPMHYMACYMEMSRFAEHIIQNEKKHRSMCNRAAKTKVYTWVEIGKKWFKMLKAL
jgi:glycosyltransferase involved in cell wall biosynthesis